MRVFMQNTRTTPQNKHFPLWNTQHCVPSKSLGYFRSGKIPTLEKMHNQSFVVLIDRQASIEALIKCTATSVTVLNCIQNLNR